MPPLLRLSLALGSLCLWQCVAGAVPLATQVTGSVSYSWNDNFSRASGAIDVRAVGLWSTNLSASRTLQIAPNLSGRMQWGGHLRLADRGQDLHEGEASVQGSLQRKLGLGPGAPRVGIDLTLRAHGAEISAKEGVSGELRVFHQQSLNDWLRLRTGGEAFERSARDDTFSLAQQTLRVSLDMDPTAWLRCSVGVSRQWGLFTAGCSAPRFAEALAGTYGPEVAAYFQSLPRVTTASFSPDWLTYRARGETDSVWLEVSPALDERTALAIRWEIVDTTNVVGGRYRQHLLHLTFVQAF